MRQTHSVFHSVHFPFIFHFLKHMHAAHTHMYLFLMDTLCFHISDEHSFLGL